MKKSTLVFKLRSFPEKSETFIVHNIVEAIKAEFEVNILCNEKKDMSSSSQPDLLKKFDLLEKTQQFRQPKNDLKRYWEAFTLLMQPGIVYYFSRLLIQEKRISLSYLFQLKYYRPYRNVETFHVHFPTHPNMLFKLRKIGFLNAKVISTFHGYDIHYVKDQELRGLKKQLKLIYSQSYAITVNTDYLRQKLVDIGGSFPALHLIPMGVDTSFFAGRPKHLPPPGGTIKLLSIGRLVEIKGHEYAIIAVHQLIRLGYKLEYTIVGEGERRQTLTSLIEKMQLTEYISLVGSKSQQEIRELLQKHYIFLMCSVTDSTGRAESQGIVNLEAQAMGLPVVAFDSGGVKFTLKKDITGFLVEEKNTEGYAKAILQIIENPLSYQEMSKAGIHFVLQEFNSKHSNNKFIQLYRKRF